MGIIAPALPLWVVMWMKGEQVCKSMKGRKKLVKDVSCLHSLATDSGWHCKFRSTQTIYNLLWQCVEDFFNAKHNICINTLLTWLNLQYGVRQHNYWRVALNRTLRSTRYSLKDRCSIPCSGCASLSPGKTQVSGSHLCSRPDWCSVSSREHQFHSLYPVLFWSFVLCAGVAASLFSDL